MLTVDETVAIDIFRAGAAAAAAAAARLVQAGAGDLHRALAGVQAVREGTDEVAVVAAGPRRRQVEIILPRVAAGPHVIAASRVARHGIRRLHRAAAAAAGRRPVAAQPVANSCGGMTLVGE